ncbi:class I SAM-dependent methyltransferase [Hansschlegelia quercus]|uniref:Methyltransferase domain-containing protein n=1 Tax=Hansschlegelia quercus TaxID=2528245 RepID=A0A4Q9GMQ3_9HYPH|nr:class I SAM-dependent methyltransferase [Hansschlegelia quercus]TBN51745.1 methyltransferase domain-containing protein [Hansschlegelia quercus]
MRKVIDADGFDEKFRSDPDPWNYVGSLFEAHKRRVLLRACGTRHFGRALEIGCAIGVTTVELAKICSRVVAVDASPTALREAARRTADLPNVTLQLVRLPDNIPPGPFDLIVVSEILYYLPERHAAAAMSALRRALAPGGRLVLLHHVRDFDDAAQKPWLAQDRARRLIERSARTVFDHAEGRFRAAAFVAPRLGSPNSESSRMRAFQ